MRLRHCLTLIALACLMAACKEPESTPPAASQAPDHVAQDNQPAPAQSAASGPSLRKLEGAQAGGTIKPSSLCNLEFLGNQKLGMEPVKVDGDSITLKGWLGDAETRATPTQGAVYFATASNMAQVWEIDLSLGGKRDDVAKFHSAPGLAQSGFVQDVPLAGLPNGTYRVYLGYSKQGQKYRCDNGRNLQIGA